MDAVHARVMSDIVNPCLLGMMHGVDVHQCENCVAHTIHRFEGEMQWQLQHGL